MNILTKVKKEIKKVHFMLLLILGLSISVILVTWEVYLHSKHMRQAVAYVLLPQEVEGQLVWDKETGQPKVKKQHLTRLVKPIITTSALLDWVREAAVMCYNYDFFNADVQINNNIAAYFTEEGGHMFRQALAEDLATVESKSIIVTAIARGVPILLAQGYVWGRWTWKVQVPLRISYQSASEIKRENLIVTVLVVASPTWENPRAIGIKQFFSKPG